MVGLAGLLVALAISFLPLTTPPTVPELELSTERAAPGDPVDVVGRGYAGCILEAPTGEPEPPSEGSEGQVGPAATSVPTPARTTEPDDFAATPTSSTGSGVLLAAFVAALLGGLGLFGLARALRRRSHRRSRPPSVSAVAAPAPPGFLDVHQRGPERTVALRVAIRVEPGALTVHRPEE